MQTFDMGAVAGMTRGGIDNVDFVDGVPGLVFHARPTTVPHGAPLLVSGWALDPASGAGAGAVVILLDRARVLPAATGISRFDIMTAHGTDEFVGYRLAIETGDLAPGAHEMRVFVLGGDGYWYETAAAGFRLFNPVLPTGRRLTYPLRLSLDDRFDVTSGRYLKPGSPLRGNHWLLLQGWAFDQALGEGAAQIFAIAEDGRSWTGPSNIERDDVASAMQAAKPSLGFEILIAAEAFSKGRHRLQLVGFDAAGNQYANALDIVLDVVSEKLRFPLTARQSMRPLTFGGRLRTVEASSISTTHKNDTKIEPGDPADMLLPVAAATIARNAEIIIEGWALDARGGPANDVYLEVTSLWAIVPPQRFQTDCGWHAPWTWGELAGGVPGSYFSALVEPCQLSTGKYEFAIVVVERDRCTYARSPIATISIVDAR